MGQAMTTTPENRPTVILVVEGEALIRMTTADILSDEGYRVVEAANADQALAVLELRHDVRTLLTDAYLPGSLNGYALARIVDMRYPGVGVIVTSGTTQPRPGDLPTKARFISKLYGTPALLREVQEILGGASGPIIVKEQRKPADPSGAAILPEGIKLTQRHTNIGPAGGLAQPLPEPEE
ncbi:MAG TPA: response regulator [Microvirga sp.]|jgi:CheY-like chemotaxis protein|nr:response regulator [Microvirga sp.]